MNRILDMSFLETVGFVMDEDFKNLIEMLHASGIPLFVWGLIFLTIASIPFIGYGLYLIGEKISHKRVIYINQDLFLQSLFCFPIALFIWDVSASKILNANDYNLYLRSLPWKATFLQPKSTYLATYYPLKQPMKEDQSILQIAADHNPIHRPNIYLFVIESLREDFITTNNSPNLHQFKQENICFDLAFSGGNGSHLAWYSIFHSNFSFWWTKAQQEQASLGSLPLKILKKLNYESYVYSSAHLSYYGMQELLFGRENQWIDYFHHFAHYYPVKAHEADRQCIDKFQEVIANNAKSEGQVHIFFLDSTHFDYSWPDHSPPKFSPISHELSYFKAFHNEKDLEKIKNRYRNAIHFVDHLFAKFVQTLKDHHLYDDAVIVVTGDHGEEFMENGHMFHNSQLNKEQTYVPIYYKFKKTDQRMIPNLYLTNHMDIFPSLLDYIFGKDLFSQAFGGSSIFDPLKWPFSLTARYNAGRSPYEFCIHNGRTKLIARFKNKKNIFASKELQIVGIKDASGKHISKSFQESEPFIWEEFGEALYKIFEPPQ